MFLGVVQRSAKILFLGCMSRSHTQGRLTQLNLGKYFSQYLCTCNTISLSHFVPDRDEWHIGGAAVVISDSKAIPELNNKRRTRTD